MTMHKLMMASVAAAVLAATPGLIAAQQSARASDAGQYVEVEDGSLPVETFGLTVDEVEDMDVVGANGEEIGEVEDVLMGPDGKISAVSVEVGGFLGIGDKKVVVELDQLSLQDDNLLIDATKEQLEAMPAWED